MRTLNPANTSYPVYRYQWSNNVQTRSNRIRRSDELTVGHNTHAVADTKIKGNVWYFQTGGSSPYQHPAKFPLQLATDHVTSWSNPGDVVLDPFLGSGTTAEAALTLDRKFIGIEISDEYMQIATKRIGA